MDFDTTKITSVRKFPPDDLIDFNDETIKEDKPVWEGQWEITFSRQEDDNDYQLNFTAHNEKEEKDIYGDCTADIAGIIDVFRRFGIIKLDESKAKGGFNETLKKIEDMCEDIKSIKEIVRNITYKID